MLYFVWLYHHRLVALFIRLNTTKQYFGRYTYYVFFRIFNYLPEQQSYTMLYVPSHTRSTPYFVGIFAAYVYRYLKLDKPKFRFPCSKTLLSILIAIYPLFLMTIQVFYVREYNLWLSVIYTFVYRMTFAAIVSVFIIICAINGLFKGKA